jgi:hypothetical protein
MMPSIDTNDKLPNNKPVTLALTVLILVSPNLSVRNMVCYGLSVKLPSILSLQVQISNHDARGESVVVKGFSLMHNLVSAQIKSVVFIPLSTPSMYLTSSVELSIPITLRSVAAAGGLLITRSFQKFESYLSCSYPRVSVGTE